MTYQDRLDCAHTQLLMQQERQPIRTAESLILEVAGDWTTDDLDQPTAGLTDFHSLFDHLLTRIRENIS